MSERTSCTVTRSRGWSGNERQTATVTEDNIDPQPSSLMEEVLRKESEWGLQSLLGMQQSLNRAA